ncbi:MAG: right-handed parallel beta-helix repeat-containing protein [Microbacterium sp.]
MEVSLRKRSGSEETIFTGTTLASKVTAAQKLNVRFQVSGTNPVKLSAKVWLQGTTEPSTWTLTYSDSSASRIKSAGGVEVNLYTSSATKVASVGFDDLYVRSLTATATATPTATATTTATPTATATTTATPMATATDSTSVTTAVDGARQTAGAGTPGETDYAVPSGAIIVSQSGSDSGAGTVASPLLTITKALSVVSDGGVIVLRGGTYHEYVLIPPQKSVTIQPYRSEAVWIDGAEEVTGWAASGSVWVLSGWTQSLDASPTFTRGAPDNTEEGWAFIDPDYPMASHPDQVWVGGAQLTEVASRAAVTTGTFYVDDSADELVIGTNPSAGVEVSTLTDALSIRSVGSTVQGIGIRRFATSVPSMGSVIVAAADVTLSNVTIRDNSTIGLYTWSENTTLQDVSLIGNGMLGAGAANADGLRITGLYSAENNSEHFNRAPVSGALKITGSDDVVVSNSVFADNYGQGPWFDESDSDVVFTGNDSLGNTGSGVVVELSEGATVTNNYVRDNGINGIYVINSGSVSLWNNTVVGNVRNISIEMNSRRSTDSTIPWITQNISMGNNVSAEPTGDCVVCVNDYSRALTGNQMLTTNDGNLYHRTSSTSPTIFAYYAQGSAGGSKSYASLADFTSATGREARSQLLEGTSPVTASGELTTAAAALQSAVALPLPSAVATSSSLTAGAVKLGATFP